MNSMEKFFHSLLVFLQPNVFDYLAFPILHEKHMGTDAGSSFFNLWICPSIFTSLVILPEGQLFKKKKTKAFL